jgi:hypothetical protein
MTLTTTFRKRTDVRYRNIGGEGIVVMQSSAEVLVVSEVGARVLELIESGNAVGGILTAITAEYDVDGAVLERDAVTYLQELLDANVIEVATT